MAQSANPARLPARSRASRLIAAAGTLLGLGGAALLLVGVSTYLRDRDESVRAVHTQGTVISVIKHLPNGGQSRAKDAPPTYAAVFNFRDTKGTVWHVTSQRDTPQPAEIGTHVSILYDPVNPAKARLDDDWSTQSRGPVLCAIGAMFLLTGAIAARRTRAR